MLVFFDDETFHWEERGGVSRYACELAAELARMPGGPEVVVFAGWAKNRTVRELAREAGGRLRVVGFPRPAGWRINKLARRLSIPWRRAVFGRVARGRSEVIYHPPLHAYDRWVAARAAAMVITVYDLLAERYDDGGRAGRFQIGTKRAALDRADAVLCISDHTRGDLARTYPEAAPRARAVPIASRVAPPGRPPAGWDWPPGRPFLLHVGNRHHYKRGDLLLQAFAAVAPDWPDLGLVLSGGRQPLAQEEAAALQPALAAGRVRLVRASDAELAWLYAQAAALVYPSEYEGFGLPPHEAQRCGCPVVTTTAASLPEVVGEAALSVPAGDGAALTAAVRRLLADPGLAVQLRAAGRAQAAQFSWARCAAETLDVYRLALAGPSSRSSPGRECSQ